MLQIKIAVITIYKLLNTVYYGVIKYIFYILIFMYMYNKIIKS